MSLPLAPSQTQVSAMEKCFTSYEEGSNTSGPPRLVYALLARQFDADAVRLAAIFPDQEKTTHEARTGTLFLVTDRVVVFADYTDARSHGGGPDDYGTLSLTIHSRSDDDSVRIDWKDRALFVVPTFEGGAGSTAIRAGRVAVTGPGWNVSLPSGFVEDGDTYFARVREAFGMA